jgi:hypothetical protein
MHALLGPGSMQHWGEAGSTLTCTKLSIRTDWESIRYAPRAASPSRLPSLFWRSPSSVASCDSGASMQVASYLVQEHTPAEALRRCCKLELFGRTRSPVGNGCLVRYPQVLAPSSRTGCPFTVNPSGQVLQDKSVQDESMTNKTCQNSKTGHLVVD